MSKIAIIHHSGLIGGAGVSLLSSIRKLSEEHDVTVFIPSEPRDISNALKKLKTGRPLTVIEYGRRIGALTYYSGGDKLLSPRFFYRLLLIFIQWRRWNRYIDSTDYDVVMVNSMILSWMGLLNSMRDKKTVCFVRETIVDSPKNWINRIIHSCLTKFTKVVFLSDYDKKSHNIHENKCCIIHDFYDKELLDNQTPRKAACDYLGICCDTFHVLYVGGVSHMKGFDLAVKAVLDCEEDVELISAGMNFEDRMSQTDGKLQQYEKNIYDYIERHKERKRIHIVGKQLNMSNCFAAADVLLFPMRSPHQARPAFEAGWFSLPVIITNFDNISDLVKNGVNGFCVSPNDVCDITDKIMCLKKNGKLRNEMGKNNYKIATAVYSEEQNSSLLKALIEELID